MSPSRQFSSIGAGIEARLLWQERILHAVAIEILELKQQKSILKSIQARVLQQTRQPMNVDITGIASLLALHISTLLLKAKTGRVF